MQAEQIVSFYHFKLPYPSGDSALPDYPPLQTSLQLTDPAPRGIELPVRKVVWDLVGNLWRLLGKACGSGIQGQVDQELNGNTNENSSFLCVWNK